MIAPPGYNPAQNSYLFGPQSGSGFLSASPGTRGGGSFLAPMGTGARGGVGALPQWGQPPPDPWAIPQFNYQQMQNMSAFIPTPTQQIQTLYAETGAPAAQRANAAAAGGQPLQQPSSGGGGGLTDILGALANSITSLNAGTAQTMTPQVQVSTTSSSQQSTTNPNIGMK